jgi:hypothetical protein
MATTSEATGFTGRAQRGGTVLATDWKAPDGRRTLQLALATVWLFDAVLQFQPYMFTKAFGNQMIAGMAAGNPADLAHQIAWAGHTIGRHAEVANTTFGLVQLCIAFGIAWRPTVKIALAGSVLWALAVWWIGEGLGQVLTNTSSPINGAPGAVILYALLAVLLWPTERQSETAPFVAARPVGPSLARGLWLVLWGSLAYDALLAANRSAQGLHDVFASMAVGQPHWLSAVDRSAARLVAGRGLVFSIVLAVILGLIALAPFLPVMTARVTLVVAVALCALIWVVGEGFGNVFSGSGTDPNTGPLLILMVAAFWPRRSAGPALPSPDPAVDRPLSLSPSGV